METYAKFLVVQLSQALILHVPDALDVSFLVPFLALSFHQLLLAYLLGDDLYSVLLHLLHQSFTFVQKPRIEQEF